MLNDKNIGVNKTARKQPKCQKFLPEKNHKKSGKFISQLPELTRVCCGSLNTSIFFPFMQSILALPVAGFLLFLEKLKIVFPTQAGEA